MRTHAHFLVFVTILLSSATVLAQQPPPTPKKQQDNAAEVDLGSFEKRADFLISSSALLIMEFSVMPGFESLPILEERFPRLKGFADEVKTELRAKDPARRAIAANYLLKLAGLVRTTAWARGDDGDDVVSIALGRYAQPIQEALESALKTDSPEERVPVAAVLLAIAPRHGQATDAMVREMNSERKERRETAFDLAANLRLISPGVIAALAADRHVDMRPAAALAAWKIGPKARKVIPVLIELLKSGDLAIAEVQLGLISISQKRNVALLALAEMGPDAGKAVPVIIKLLKKPNEDNQSECLSCLAKIGASAADALPTLSQHLTAKNPLRLHTAASILCIDPTDAPALDALAAALKCDVNSTRAQAVKACAELGPRSKVLVPFLIAALKEEDESMQLDAICALGNIGPLAGEAIPALGRMLTSPERNYRFGNAAASALGKIGKGGIPVLVRSITPLSENSAPLVLGLMGKDAAAAMPALVVTLDYGNMFSLAALGYMKSGAAPARQALLRSVKTPIDRAKFEKRLEVDFREFIRALFEKEKPANPDAMKTFEKQLPEMQKGTVAMVTAMENAFPLRRILADWALTQLDRR